MKPNGDGCRMAGRLDRRSSISDGWGCLEWQSTVFAAYKLQLRQTAWNKTVRDLSSSEACDWSNKVNSGGPKAV